MKPLLTMPDKKRLILFGPIALGGFLLAFIILAIATQNFLATILLAPVAGVGAAYALLGWPRITRKDGRPLVEPKHVPFLFFAVAPILFLVLYPLLGIVLTSAGFPIKFVAITSLALALAIACTAAYFLVGFPDFMGAIRKEAQRFPPERRPFLFFPAFVVFFLILYMAFGVVSTRMLGSSTDVGSLLNLQVLVLLPLSVLLAAGLAYLVFGFPKVKHNPLEAIEKVPGRRRPLAFFLTFLLLGLPLTVALGALVSEIGALPQGLLLPMGVVLGFSVSLGVAALTWGTPQRWRKFADYKPGLPKHTRVPLLVLGIVATIALTTILFGLIGIDLFWGLLTGTALGLLLGLQVSGATKRIAARKGEATLVPELPDGVKPLVLFPAWFLLTALLFTIFTYVLPDLVPINFLFALVTGLAVSLVLVEQGLFQEMREDRRREKEKRKSFEQRRKERLEAGLETEQGH